MQRAIGVKAPMPTGYYVGYGGQFENLAEATRRLQPGRAAGPVPDSKRSTRRSGAVKPALLVYFNIPIRGHRAVLVALFLRGVPFQHLGGIGFIDVRRRGVERVVMV